MTDSLTVEQKKNRRGLLALVGAGGAAAVAALLGRSNGAKADGTVHYDSNTPIPAVHGNNTNRGPGVEGTSYSLAGVWGESAIWHGVHGTNTSGGPHAAGVYGQCSENIGVYGDSITGNGVRGRCSSGYGVYGWSYTSYGVRGHSDGSYGLYGDSYAKAGVYGYSENSVGVYGWGNGGAGVYGISSLSSGVYGYGKPGVYGVSGKTNGSGVRGDGDSPGSIGVFAKNIPARRALRTKGQVQMDCARKKTLSNKGNLVTLPSSVRAGSNAAVLATMQGNPGNDAVIQRAFRVDSSHIRIVFNKTPANPTLVAYWVVHPS